MRALLAIAGALAVLGGGVAQANTISDPTGDFLSSYTGPHEADLDVTSFTVDYNAATSSFLLGATLAGPIDPSTAGLYVIGVDTGTGVIAPFASIGEPKVVFNQAIVVQKSGAASVGATSLSATISGDSFSVVVPLSALPTTGFTPTEYGFNLWPRDGLGNNAQISDFAPQNATLSAVPEPSTWAMMIGGTGLMGAAMRRRRGSRSMAHA